VSVKTSDDVRAMRPLNVLMVSTSYPANLKDWRGLFIRHLADALGRREDLHLSLWAPPGEVHPRIARACTPAEDAWLANLVQRGGIAHLLRTNKLAGVAAGIALLRKLAGVFRREPADVYHINWLQNALSLPPNRRPALISVLGADMRLLKLPMMRSLVRRVCRKRSVVICPNADWMVPSLRTTFGDVAQIQVVPFGIDPCWYAMSRQFEQQTQPNWLVISRITRDKLGDLFEWCAPQFSTGQRKLHLFGPMLESIGIPAWVDYHGPAAAGDLCETWFPKAQGLITLSRHAEGRPQVMLEAMAAGLPIIASRLPAHENLLDHQSTGWLADSPTGLERGLAYLESIPNNISMGVAARTRVRAEFGTWDDCAQRYNALYRQLLSADSA
jgi:glycosyltransferase involved in cell wall biosynthesis